MISVADMCRPPRIKIEGALQSGGPATIFASEGGILMRSIRPPPATPLQDAHDAVLHLMRKYGAPIDRESYIHFAYGQTVPDWTPELEAELPAELQDWSQFERRQ